MRLKIEVKEHLYTTDFYQKSAFNPDHQIISIYYYVQPLEPITARLSTFPFQFDEDQLKTYEAEKEMESFRFIDWENLTEEIVTLPIDKIVVGLIKG